MGDGVLATERSPGPNVLGDSRVDSQQAYQWATRVEFDGVVARFCAWRSSWLLVPLIHFVECSLDGSVLRALTEHRPQFENLVILVCAVGEHREPSRLHSASHFCEYHR